jgi:TonB-linked SusC/RagA family outer membrane protein
MRVLRSTLPVVLLVGLFGAFAPLQAQTGSVTGTVRDAETGQPLVGVQMVLVGTNQGALTNAEGRYLLPGVEIGEATVRALIIGYAQAEQTVNVTGGAPAVADFSLSTSAIGLEAIVVNAATGREQRARELGANVAQIDIGELNAAPITSFSEALGGRTAGVVLGDINGTTGTSQRIRIRGANSLSLSNEPLIFVDGIVISQGNYAASGLGGQEPSRLNDLNPSDIENIEVVKGPAAAALYGTAAANGVILITTKRGRPGATQWEFSAETGVMQDVTPYPVNFRSVTINDPNAPIFTADGAFNSAAVSTCENRAAAAGICTQDQTFGFNTAESVASPFVDGSRERYTATVRGGNEGITFYVSGQIDNESGIIDFNTQDRINVRGNLDARLSDNADLGFSVGYTDNTTRLNGNDNNAESPVLNLLFGYPNLRTNPDGTPSIANYGFGRGPDEYAARIVAQEVDRLIASTRFNYRPTDWLSLNATGGIDFTAQHDFEEVQPNGALARFGTNNRLGFRESDRTNVRVYTAIANATASFELSDELTSTTTLGSQYDETTSNRSECFGVALVAGTRSCGTTSEQFAIDEDFFSVKTFGIFATQEFGWRDKLFTTLAVRADDNSAFGADFGLVVFPSAQVSYVIGEEDWFPELDFLSNLRVRGAWGQSGVRPDFRDAVTLFSPTTVNTPAGNDEPGVVLSTTGNTQLSPERATEIEFGFDAGFFEDRVGVDFTFFNKNSQDALIARRLPGSLGLTTDFFDNLGEIRNRGTELTINLDVYQSENVGFNLGFTNTTLDNQVVELGQGIEPIIFNRGLQRHEEGFSAGGFWQTEYTFSDPNGDGLLEVGDVQLTPCTGDLADGCNAGERYIGPSLPEWNRTLFADVRLFDWINISTLFEGRGGHFTGNDSFAFRCQQVSSCAARSNPNTSLENQARFIADSFLGSAYGYVEQADFWRWRELSVAFDMPSFVTESAPQLDGLRLTLAGRNLATFTDYTGLDPETNEGGGSANFSQSEFNTQPPLRTFTLRLDYRF